MKINKIIKKGEVIDVEQLAEVTGGSGRGDNINKGDFCICWPIGINNNASAFCSCK